MGKPIFFKQCRLAKTIPEGTKHQISWIPEEYANINSVVKLRDEDGNWDDGWVVRQAGQKSVEERFLPDLHKEIRGHRKSTGDSLPK